MTTSETSGESTSGYTGAMPTEGARVVTADGADLGKVKEVAATCFKVDVSMHPDYWLGTDTIASVTDTEVRLSVAKDGVSDVKVAGPEHGGAHSHTA
jgi:hypothetical protein